MKKREIKTKNEAQNLSKSAMALVIFAMVGKVLGFVREQLKTNYFGAGIETDAFNASLRATSLLSMIVTAAIANTFIPMISRVRKEEGDDTVNYHSNNMLSLSIIAGAIMTLIGIVFSPIIVKLVGGGFNDETFSLTMKLTRMGMPVIIFSAILGVMTGILQSKGYFGATGAIPIPLNAVYIIYLVGLSSKFGIEGLTIASILAVVAEVIFLYPETKRTGHKYFPVFNPKDKYVRHALALSAPVLFSVAINDFNIMINTRFASSLQTGTVTWLNLSNQMNLLVLGIFVSAITSIAFPILSKHFSEGNYTEGRKSMAFGVRLIMLITIPATIGLIVLSQPIIEIAFLRGKFTQFDADQTAMSLKFYALSLTALSLSNLLNRVYYSLQDTTTPLIISAISVVLNIIFNAIFIRFIGHRGIALGLSLATNISVFLSFLVLRKKIGHFYGYSYLRAFIKNAVAALIMGVFCYISYFGIMKAIPGLDASTLTRLLILMIVVFIAIIIYGAISYLLGVGEIRMLIEVINQKLGRTKNKELSE